MRVDKMVPERHSSKIAVMFSRAYMTEHDLSTRCCRFSSSVQFRIIVQEVFKM